MSAKQYIDCNGVKYTMLANKSGDRWRGHALRDGKWRVIPALKWRDDEYEARADLAVWALRYSAREWTGESDA